MLILEINKILILFFPVSVGGTYDKGTTALRFLVLVLQLNILTKQNKLILWQPNILFIASFIPAYFEELPLPINIKGIQDAVRQTDRQITSVISE